MDGDYSPDTNGLAAFVDDSLAGTTSLVSFAPETMALGNGPSTTPAISDTGRYVAFASTASDLYHDTNGASDIFLFDFETGKGGYSLRQDEWQSVQRCESHAIHFLWWLGGGVRVGRDQPCARVIRTTRGTSLSGQVVSDTTSRVLEKSDGTIGDGASAAPEMAGAGDVVIFHSLASNLVSNDTNAKRDVFAHTLATSATDRVSVSNSEQQGNGASFEPSISDDGQVVAFHSDASNLIGSDTNAQRDVFVRTATREQQSVRRGMAQPRATPLARFRRSMHRAGGWPSNPTQQIYGAPVPAAMRISAQTYMSSTVPRHH